MNKMLTAMGAMALGLGLASAANADTFTVDTGTVVSSGGNGAGPQRCFQFTLQTGADTFVNLAYVYPSAGFVTTQMLADQDGKDQVIANLHRSITVAHSTTPLTIGPPPATCGQGIEPGPVYPVSGVPRAQ